MENTSCLLILFQVREAQMAQYNFILVVGQSEMENKTVSVRVRDAEAQQVYPLSDFIMTMQRMEAEFK